MTGRITTVAIDGDRFLIDGDPTYAGRRFGPVNWTASSEQRL